MYKLIDNLVTTFVCSVQAEGGKGGFCPGAFVLGGLCPGGAFVRGSYVRGLISRGLMSYTRIVRYGASYFTIQYLV